MTSFTELAGSRFSVRKFRDIPVPEELLAEILDVARLAPTAKNLQPFRIYVLQSERSREMLDSLTHVRFGAETVLVFTYREDEEWKHPKEEGVHSGVEDVSIVATHIMLKAKELGIDSTWCNMFPNRALEAAMGLDQTEKSVLVMPLGYHEDGVEPSPMHYASKSIEELVRFI